MKQAKKLSIFKLNRNISAFIGDEGFAFNELKQRAESHFNLLDILEVSAYVLWQAQDLEREIRELCCRTLKSSGGLKEKTMGYLLNKIPDDVISKDMKRRLRLVVRARNYIAHKLFEEFLSVGLDETKDFLAKTGFLTFEATDAVDSAIARLGNSVPVQNVFDNHQ